MQEVSWIKQKDFLSALHRLAKKMSSGRPQFKYNRKMKPKEKEQQENIEVDVEKEAQQDMQENEQAEATELSELELLEQKIATLDQEKNDLHDKYLRLYSDFENYKKNKNKERLELITTASESVISNILPVLDDFDRAIKEIQKNTVEGEENAHLEGMQLIYDKLLNVLKQKGLSEIEAMGAVFDTDLHEAVAQFPTEDAEQKGKVIEVVQKGYKLSEKVIRWAKVVVAC